MAIDHYAVLGLPSGVEGAKLSEEEIKKAYKRKLLEVHPDKGKTESSEEFLALQESYEVLLDRHKRIKLDEELRKPKQQTKAKRSRDEFRKREAAELKAKMREMEEKSKANLEALSKLVESKTIAAERARVEAKEAKKRADEACFEDVEVANAARLAALEAKRRADQLAKEASVANFEAQKRAVGVLSPADFSRFLNRNRCLLRS